MVRKCLSGSHGNLRDANLDLLRILATLFVIILHYNNTGSGKAFLYTAELGYHYQMLLFLEVCSICAVNIFVLITGYYQSQSNSISLGKPLTLLAELAVFTILRYIAGCALGNEVFSVSTFLACFLPRNWYIVVYIALYLLSPFLNILISVLSKKQFKWLLICLFVVCSCLAYAVDLVNTLTGLEIASPLGLSGSGGGYTLVSFIFLYFVGAYLRNAETIRSPKIILLISGVVYLFSAFLLFFQARIQFSTALYYNNPVVIVQAVSLFVLFQSIRFKSAIINSLAKVSFGVYLLHSFFFSFVNIADQVTGNLLVIPVYAVLSSIGIYLASGAVYYLYSISLGRIVRIAAKRFKKITICSFP